MNTKYLIERAAHLLAGSNFNVALTGAGLSTPSGIPDYRSEASGLWTHQDAMQVASIVGFKHAPHIFYEWIAPYARVLLDAQPNPAHFALARMEAIGKLCSIVTQNIDMLHTKSGSKTVYEVHGHLREATCMECFTVYPSEALIDEFLHDDGKKVLHCEKCNGVLKPNVILYGEQLPARVFSAASRDARQCEVMLVAGSSLEVYPVAGLPQVAMQNRAKLIIVNYDPTPYDEVADVVIHADVAEVLPEIVECMEAT